MQSILQTEEWAKFKSGFGWNFDKIASLYVLKKELPFGKRLLYLPEVWLGKDSAETIKKIVTYARKDKQAIFLNLEILNPHDQCPINLAPFGFLPSFEEIQPRWRQVVSLAGDKEAILARMKEKGRYNTRLAQKKGVKVEVRDEIMFLEDDADLFYKLFLETARRDRFLPRGKDYFRELLRLLYKNQLGFLVTASFQDTPLVALIISLYDGTASYLYGASSSQERNRMAPYLAHLTAMLEAKRRNAKEYDLLAISPPDGLNSPLYRKYAGITRFKESLGGEKRAITGGFDLVLKPNWYKLYRFLEKIRRR